MKRYLFFQTPDSDFQLDSPVFVLCGNPRIAVLNPVSNAIAFLWEQLEPNPITNPITINPNNTSRNITITVPNNITTDIKLKVTLNGDSNNFRIINIVLKLIDLSKSFAPGSGLLVSSNTINDPVPLLLAPYPPSGPQVINYTNNTQTTGVNFLSQSYRNSYTDKIEVYTNNNTFIQEIDVFKTVYEKFLTKDDRINLNVNTSYNILKKWIDIKVLSQPIIPISQKINLSFPNIIADEYATYFSPGTGLAVFLRTPFTAANQVLSDTLPNNFAPGSGLAVFLRTPFTAANQSLQDTLPNNFASGTGLAVFLRTPYTSNIVG